MKMWLFFLLFLPVAAYGQFRMVSSSVTLVSTVNDSTYIVDVDFFADQTAKGYYATGITTSYRLFSQTGQLYSIDSTADLTLSSATLKITELDNNYVDTEAAPVGQILVYNPQGDYVTYTPFGNSNMGQVLQQAVGTYNAVVSAEGGVISQWDSGNTYLPNQQVAYNGSIYTNKTGINTTTIPIEDLTNWELTNKAAILEDINGRDTISQASHSFSVGDPLWYSGDYILSLDTGLSVRVDGVVIDSVDANNFVWQKTGRFTLASHGFTAGVQLYVQSDGTYNTVIGDNAIAYGYAVNPNEIEIGFKPDRLLTVSEIYNGAITGLPLTKSEAIDGSFFKSTIKISNRSALQTQNLVAGQKIVLENTGAIYQAVDTSQFQLDSTASSNQLLGSSDVWNLGQDTTFIIRLKGDYGVTHAMLVPTNGVIAMSEVKKRSDASDTELLQKTIDYAFWLGYSPRAATYNNYGELSDTVQFPTAYKILCDLDLTITDSITLRHQVEIQGTGYTPGTRTYRNRLVFQLNDASKSGFVSDNFQTSSSKYKISDLKIVVEGNAKSAIDIKRGYVSLNGSYITGNSSRELISGMELSGLSSSYTNTDNFIENTKKGLYLNNEGVESTSLAFQGLTVKNSDFGIYADSNALYDFSLDGAVFELVDTSAAVFEGEMGSAIFRDIYIESTSLDTTPTFRFGTKARIENVSFSDSELRTFSSNPITSDSSAMFDLGTVDFFALENSIVTDKKHIIVTPSDADGSMYLRNIKINGSRVYYDANADYRGLFYAVSDDCRIWMQNVDYSVDLNGYTARLNGYRDKINTSLINPMRLETFADIRQIRSTETQIGTADSWIYNRSENNNGNPYLLRLSMFQTQGATASTGYMQMRSRRASTTTTANALYLESSHESGGNVTNLNGIEMFIGPSNASTSTLSTVRGLKIDRFTDVSGTATINNIAGIEISDLSSGNSTVVAARALYIKNQTGTAIETESGSVIFGDDVMLSDYGNNASNTLSSLSKSKGNYPYPVLASDGTITNEGSIPAADINGLPDSLSQLKHTYNIGADGDTIPLSQNTYILLGDADGFFYIDTTGYNGQARLTLYSGTSDTTTVQVVNGNSTAFSEFGISSSSVILKGNGQFKEYQYQDGIFRLIGYSGNLYTGWAEYADSTYTEGSPFSLSSGVKVVLPNDAGGVRDSQIPLGIDSLYQASDSTITGRNGDGLNITIEFKSKPTTAAVTKLTVAIDIGGSVGEIYLRDFIMSKGNGAEHYYISSFNAYTLDTWEGNGGQVKIVSDAAADVYNIRYVLTRTHKAR